jgi:O-antigen/teichoic acid export membrane protein
MTERPAATLNQRFLGSAAWVGGSRAIMVLFGLGVTATLARLLAPADYGLIGMAQVILGLLQQTRDLGLGQALVRRREISADTCARAFTLALLQGALLAILTLLSAGLVASFFGEPRVAPLLRVLALGFPLAALQTVPLALLRRDLTLKGEAAARTAASVGDAALTIALAAAGAGAWALVAGQLAHSLILSGVLAWLHPWRPRLRLRGGETRELLRFGAGVTTSSLLWYVYSNADFVIIGRVLGPGPLGLYTLAWNVAKMPWDQVWISISPMVLPLLSRSRDLAEGMGAPLLRLTRGLSLITFPSLAGLAVVAGEAVPVLLGPRWEASTPALRWLCLYGIARAMSVLLHPVLVAAGRLRKEVAFGAVLALVLPPAFYLGTAWGIAGVAAVWALLYPLLAAVILLPGALRASGLPLRRYLAALAPASIAAAATALAVAATRLALGAFPAALALGLEIALGVLVYVAVLRLASGIALLTVARGLWRDMRAGMGP